MGRRPPHWLTLKGKPSYDDPHDLLSSRLQLLGTVMIREEFPTCHALDNSRCFDEVSGLHVLCSDDPSFAVPARYQSNIS